jgi:hypothetical protein
VAFRAFISFSKPRVSSSHEKPQLLTSREKASLADIYVDPDSKNKVLSESIPLSEVTSVVFTKPLQDSAALISSPMLQLELNKTDGVSVADSFERVVSYERSVSDVFALDDSALINKDFTGTKGNVFGFSDTSNVGVTKEVTESALLSDAVSFTFGYSRSFTESLSFNEDLSRSIAKTVSPDSVTFADVAQVTLTRGGLLFNRAPINVSTLG